MSKVGIELLGQLKKKRKKKTTIKTKTDPLLRRQKMVRGKRFIWKCRSYLFTLFPVVPCPKLLPLVRYLRTNNKSNINKCYINKFYINQFYINKSNINQFYINQFDTNKSNINKFYINNQTSTNLTSKNPTCTDLNGSVIFETQSAALLPS